MFSKRLASFVKEQIKEGHDLASVKRYLEGYGYQEKDIEDAVNSIYQKKGPDYRKIVLIAVVLIVIVLVVSYFYVLKPGKKETWPEISLRVELSKTELMPGETLRFNVDISSPSVKRYILDMEQSIIYRNSAVSKSSKKIEFSRRSLTQESLKLPDKIKQGDYTLEVKVYYDNKVESAASTFRVIGELVEEEEEIIEEEKEKEEDEEKVTEEEEKEIGEEEEKKKEIEEVKVEEEAFEGLTIWEKIRKVKNLSLVNLKKAEDFCKGVVEETYKDQCFVNIAEARKDIKYCEFVVNERAIDDCYSIIAKVTQNSLICERVSEKRSDYCYMNFVTEEDYSVCPKLINKYLKQTCETMSMIKK